MQAFNIQINSHLTGFFVVGPYSERQSKGILLIVKSQSLYFLPDL